MSVNRKLQRPVAAINATGTSKRAIEHRPGSLKVATCACAVLVAVLAIAVTRSKERAGIAESGPREARPEHKSAFGATLGTSPLPTPGSPGDPRHPSHPAGAEEAIDASPTARPVPSWLDGGPWGFDDLAAFWSEEHRDHELSVNVESYIYAMLETPELGLDVLRGVDCRQTLCRIEMNISHMQAIMGLQKTASRSNFRFAQRLMPTEGGNSLIIYVAREELAERVFGPDGRERDAGTSNSGWKPSVSGQGAPGDRREQ